MVRIWQAIMLPPVFTTAAGLVRQAVGNDWGELVRRVPGLEGK